MYEVERTKAGASKWDFVYRLVTFPLDKDETKVLHVKFDNDQWTVVEEEA